ncbi:transcriptional regulator [Amycolatopsis taiwanensis]|uniref:transcriptional regulator n=1 Tax=Amycolatopsis taiwanensis TaxID=342230 RepID=UPI00048A376F|nr:transcriptional regulator [Amycolatopsis taiwanensis]
MTELDPVIHAPTRLRIMAALAVLAEGDSLSFSRLQHMLDLTPGNLITHLRKLDEANYITSAKTKGNDGTRTSIHLTHTGRAAFESYSATVQKLLNPTPDKT